MGAKLEEPKIADVKKLSTELKKETTDLRDIYVQKVKDWAVLNHQAANTKAEEYSKLSATKRAAGKDFNFNRYYTLQKWYYGSGSYMLRMNVDNYVKKEADKALFHYEGSIDKLAIRILKKGLNPDKITITSASVGVNISATITDGDKTVRAWTIVASGDIQRPHYRYLIK